ncbi:hypothetical protein SD427_14490 [Chryseobacterium sp. JJR-5R]|uniref:hypothetical protein n=1 Tax=Chryseobacterium sp. JJR-5R TaxID=3093923 RepID=UPI002A7624C8|nr:hypothetical protein [Chryseobacterium sp. JJR-5R]WPO81966.1 hypothetical protein SD427_14490 [Chryseobacterium sp. JJR-5R]
MKYFIYTLEHIYTDESHTGCKLLGFFDDLEKLEQVKSFASELSGFKNYPKSLIVEKYEINKIHWECVFNSVMEEIGRDYLTESDPIDEMYLSVKELGLKSVFSVDHSYTIHRYLDDWIC